LLQHLTSGGLGEKKAAGQINVQNLFPAFEGHVFGHGSPRGACVVYQNIDAAEPFNRRVNDGLDLLRVGNIANLPDHIAALCREFIDGIVKPFNTAGTEHQVRPGFRQSFGHFFTDAA
jgi:hypothetical protein